MIRLADDLGAVVRVARQPGRGPRRSSRYLGSAQCQRAEFSRFACSQRTPRGSARVARFTESGGVPGGDGRVACRGLLLGAYLALIRGSTLPGSPQSRRVEFVGE